MTIILTIITLILAVIILFAVGAKLKNKIVKLVALIPLILTILVCAANAFYTQDIGEVIVVKNWDGAIVTSTENPGFHTKLPWQTTICNMLINFYGSSDYHYEGGAANGPDVTINDKSGASADIDIQVVYSLDPSAAIDLYANYGTQTNYTSSYLSNDVRSIAREVSGRFDTITMLTDRAQYTDAVENALNEKWSENGLHVEQVSVQDVRYPTAITSKYSEAQAAEIAKQQAINEQQTAKVQAETKLINAQAEADANQIINESLTDNVIQQHYIDALIEIGKNGNLVVVPEGSQSMLQIQNKNGSESGNQNSNAVAIPSGSNDSGETEATEE